MVAQYEGPEPVRKYGNRRNVVIYRVVVKARSSSVSYVCAHVCICKGGSPDRLPGVLSSPGHIIGSSLNSN